MKGGKGKSRVSMSDQGGEGRLTGEGAAVVRRERRAHSSSASGLHLILSNACEIVPESPLHRVSQQDPLRCLEAESLLGYQKGLGFSFSTEDIGHKDRLVVMEEVDVNKKVIKGRVNGEP